MGRNGRAPAGVSPGPPWILVVDDEQEVVGVVVMVVASISGMTVRTCSSGLEAQDLIEQHGAPTLAILDVLLSGRHGIDVARRIRYLPHGTLCQVLFLSSIAYGPIGPLVARVRPFAFLHKPVTPEYLRDIVQQALEHWASVA